MAPEDVNKMAHATDNALESNESEDQHGQPHVDEDTQRGVQDVEAVTLSWSKTTLIMVFLK